MLLHSEAGPFEKARTSNATDTAYAAVATTTEPTGGGVVELATIAGAAVPNSLLVVPYALGADNDTFNVRVIGWSRVSTDLWVPVVLAEYLCTASAAVGVAGASVLNTERFADTLSLVALMGVDAQGTTKVTPADDTPAHFTVSVKGFQKAEFLFKKGGATSVNALFRRF